MNTDRDRFLTEVMGRCLHKWSPWSAKADEKCLKCGAYKDDEKPADFSTWPGFGALWEWVQGQEWLEDLYGFLRAKKHPGTIIHPDRFANAVYEFLKEAK